MNLADFIRDVPDFPVPGIVFKDITTLMQNGDAFRFAANQILGRYLDQKIDKVLGIESRGFIFGAIVAYKLGCGFIPARKPGKLPAAAIREDYELEYGSASLEIHADAIKAGENVLIVDDLLATGGTLQAAVKLVERLGGRVAAIECLIELQFLKGREKLAGYPFHSILVY